MLRCVKIVAIVFLTICFTDAATPIFLQAIQSALGSMPLSGFPMTAGLTSAKLAIGGKLLYFLGLFGRRSSPKPMVTTFNSGFNGAIPQFPGGFSSNPSMFPGGFSSNPSMFPSSSIGFSEFGQSASQKQNSAMENNPVQQNFMASNKQSVNPAVLMGALANQGINPLQLMQALESAGLDPAQVMQSLTSGSENVNAGLNSGSSFDSPGKRAGQSKFPSQNVIPSGFMNEMPQDLSDSLPPDSENLRNPDEDKDEDSGNNEDVESFFSFMKEMDDNKCISRLICDIGANPDFLGEFSKNIDTIISSLDVSSESGAYDYIQIMNSGRNGENCTEKFTECDDESYDIVKSVAPSVGVPGGISSESVNKL